MAIRIENLGKHSVSISLRGGGTMVVPAGGKSPAIREELVYGNPYIADWQHQGLVRRVPVSIKEVYAQERGEQEAAKQNLPQYYPVDEIETIDGKDAEVLISVGIKTSKDLLSACSNKAGIKALGEKTKIEEEKIEEWVKIADLMRVKGIGSEYRKLP